MIIQDSQLESLEVILPVPPSAEEKKVGDWRRSSCLGVILPPSPEEKKVGEGAAASALGEPTCLSLLLDFFGEQEGRPQ